jgi:hypothetical protein
MLVTAVDDAHMIKWKQGWFTLVKYNYEAEKNREGLKAELKEFSAQN